MTEITEALQSLENTNREIAAVFIILILGLFALNVILRR